MELDSPLFVSQQQAANKKKSSFIPKDEAAY